jgi:hypothetical protein
MAHVNVTRSAPPPRSDRALSESDRRGAQPAIDAVQDGSCASLSAAYRWTVVPEPGRWEGRAYDMRMEDLSFNHVALVPQGRIGAQSVIGDASPFWLEEQRAFMDLKRRLVCAA